MPVKKVKKVFEYKYALLTAHHDGDSLTIDIDFGFRTKREAQPVRLAGSDAPEISSKDPLEKAAGLIARDMLVCYYPAGSLVEVATNDTGAGDKYGRCLASVKLVGDPRGDASTWMIKMLLAVPYFGVKKPAWDRAFLQNIVDSYSREACIKPDTRKAIDALKPKPAERAP